MVSRESELQLISDEFRLSYAQLMDDQFAQQEHAVQLGVFRQLFGQVTTGFAAFKKFNDEKQAELQSIEVGMRQMHHLGSKEDIRKFRVN